jgi:predicted Zn-dependent peptidase
LITIRSSEFHPCGFLGVTREEIQAVAKRYLRNEKRAIVFRAPVNAGLPAGAGKKEAA